MKKQTQTDGPTVIGIDLGDTKHAICVLGKGAEVLKEYSIANRRQDLERVAAEYPAARVALEAGTHSPWVSRLLQQAGLEVVVANPRKVRAIHDNPRKCDRHDARLLAQIAQFNPKMLEPVCHGSEPNQIDLLSIKLRDTLVRQRVAIISSVRGTLKALGVGLKSTSSASFDRQARQMLEGQHEHLLDIVAPALAALEALSAQIKLFDKAIEQMMRRHAPAQKLQQIGGVGPITALAFVLYIEDPARFKDRRDVGAYLGLVPRRDQSGNSDKQLPISKGGNRYLRTLLVQCAQYLLGHFGADCELRRYGLRLAVRGGKAAKKKAVVAVARKLAVLMLTLWSRDCDYEPLHTPRPSSVPPAADQGRRSAPTAQAA
jgi:transposase